MGKPHPPENGIVHLPRMEGAPLVAKGCRAGTEDGARPPGAFEDFERRLVIRGGFGSHLGPTNREVQKGKVKGDHQHRKRQKNVSHPPLAPNDPQKFVGEYHHHGKNDERPGLNGVQKNKYRKNRRPERQKPDVEIPAGLLSHEVAHNKGKPKGKIHRQAIGRADRIEINQAGKSPRQKKHAKELENLEGGKRRQRKEKNPKEFQKIFSIFNRHRPKKKDETKKEEIPEGIGFGGKKSKARKVRGGKDGRDKHEEEPKADPPAHPGIRQLDFAFGQALAEPAKKPEEEKDADRERLCVIKRRERPGKNNERQKEHGAKKTPPHDLPPEFLTDRGKTAERK